LPLASKAPDPANPTTTEVTVELRSTPPGATATIDGVARRLPATIARALGKKVTVQIEKDGYEPQTVEVSFDGQARSKMIDLVPVEPRADDRASTAIPKKKAAHPSKKPPRFRLLPPPTPPPGGEAAKP
jgi:hypothetical protein